MLCIIYSNGLLFVASVRCARYKAAAGPRLHLLSFFLASRMIFCARAILRIFIRSYRFSRHCILPYIPVLTQCPDGFWPYVSNLLNSLWHLLWPYRSMQYATQRYYFSYLIDEDFSRLQLIIFGGRNHRLV